MSLGACCAARLPASDIESNPASSNASPSLNSALVFVAIRKPSIFPSQLPFAIALSLLRFHYYALDRTEFGLADCGIDRLFHQFRCQPQPGVASKR
jgi:hypothetical protein